MDNRHTDNLGSLRRDTPARRGRADTRRSQDPEGPIRRNQARLLSPVAQGSHHLGRRVAERVFLVIGAIVLVLIILGVGAAVLLNRNDTARDPIYPTTSGPTSGGTAPTGGSSAPPTVVNSKADEAVKSYLEALAAGQAAVALALGKEQPTDTTFLTDAVLADSLKRAPITAITVSPPDDEYDNSIEASYKLGDQQVNETFTVQKSATTTCSTTSPRTSVSRASAAARCHC